MSRLGELEVVRESLVAVVNEMRANVIHASYSSIIYEGHDFSCALVAADGRLVAQSLDDNPLHIFAVPYSTREVVRVFAGDINEGDIFLHNDPYTGGTHLNDILMLYPVFHDGRLALFAAVRCHWGDVGGMTPGSLSGRVNEIYQEGMRITPTRICEQGRMNQAFLELLFTNMRIPAERKGDFNTMLGACRKAAEHLDRLFKRFGPQTFLDSIEELMRRAETLMRACIREWPDGVYYAEGYVESDGHDPTPLVAPLTLTIDGDRIIADFTGASAQTKGPTNVGPAMALNAVGTIVKAFLDPKTAINHGSFQPIELINPEGTFINARAPVPCGGMVEVKAMLDSVVAAALGQARPERLVGDLKGGGNHVYISGPRPDGDGIYLLYEYPAGGTGASAGVDGNHTMRTYAEGDFNSLQSVEIVESQSPLRVEQCALREGFCGDGAFRGGVGLRRDIRILNAEATLSVLSDRNIIPPYGVAGGSHGAANRFTVVRDGETIEPAPIPGKVAGFPLQEGDIVRMESAGGGGYGDALERDPERVRADVEKGYISRRQAEARYGVVLGADGAVDPRTEAMRETLRAARIHVTLQLANDDSRDGPRRLFPLPAEIAGRLGVGEGDLVELSTGRGAAVRGWVAIAQAADDGALRLGPRGLGLLDASPGDRVEVRVVRPGPAI